MMSDTQPALGGATERVAIDAIVIGKRHRKDWVISMP